MVALVASWVPAASLADGDPASDVLLSQALFLPWDAGVSATQQGQLAGLLHAAARSGYQLRVALIASPSDLGSVTELWRDPQSYAEFLGQELSLAYHGTLLVVMPNGLGLYRFSGATPTERASLASLHAPGSDASLGSAALTAIQRVSSASGHTLGPLRTALTSTAPATGTHAATNDTLPWIVFLLGCLLIASTWTASLLARPLHPRGRHNRLAE
jgi:hypothetical protein